MREKNSAALCPIALPMLKRASDVQVVEVALPDDMAARAAARGRCRSPG